MRGSRRGYNEGIIILNNGRPVVVEYEVEVEEEEISSTTTTTTTTNKESNRENKNV